MEDRKPWTRLRGESQKAFRAFCVFRDLGPRRSVAAVRRAIYPTARDSFGRLHMWSKEFRWDDRITAWDEKADRIKQAAFEDELIASTKRAVRQTRSTGVALSVSASELLRRIHENPAALQELDIVTLLNLVARIAILLPKVQLAERAALIGGNGMLPDKLAAQKGSKDECPQVVIEVVAE